MTPLQRTWAGVIAASGLVLGALATGAFLLLRQSRVPGPADTLDVISASWTGSSPPTAEVMFRLRRADGRPASQSVTIGTAKGQPAYLDEDLNPIGTPAAPAYHYSVTFKRQPRAPLILRVTAHSDELMVARPREVETVSPSHDLFTRQIVIPPPPPD